MPDDSKEPGDGEEPLSMRAELAARDRYLRHKMWQMTPRERLAAMAHFMRRNFKARAIDADEDAGGPR